MPRSSAPLCILHTAQRLGLAFRREAGRGHPSGSEDVIPHVVKIVLAAHSVDHRTEDHQTIVAVFPAAARLKSNRAAAKKMDVILMSAQLEAMLVKFRAEDLSRTSGMT